MYIPCKIMSYVVSNLPYNEFTLGPTAPATLLCMIQAFEISTLIVLKKTIMRFLAREF
jgi:hypothetical protein